MRASLIETVATKEAHAFCTAGDSKIQGEWIVSIRVKWNTRRIDRDLVGERSERGQHTCAAHDDTGICLANAVQCCALLEIVEPADVATALQVDEGMSENEIVLADVLVVPAHIVGELRPP